MYVWVQYRTALQHYRCLRSSWYRSLGRWWLADPAASPSWVGSGIWKRSSRVEERGFTGRARGAISWALGLLLTLVATVAGLTNPHSLGNLSACVRER